MSSIVFTARRARRLPSVLGASLLALAAAGVAAPALAQDPPAATPAAAPVAGGVAAWNLPSADLPADPSVRFGVLPNGMRYALKHNETPKGAAVIRFAFDVG